MLFLCYGSSQMFISFQRVGSVRLGYSLSHAQILPLELAVLVLRKEGNDLFLDPCFAEHETGTRWQGEAHRRPSERFTFHAYTV